MWLHVPSVSSPCAQGSEDLTSASIEPFDPGPFATSSGKPLRRPSSWQGWKRRGWIKLLSGTISRPSEAESGVERWISSLPDTRASLSVRQGSNKGERTPGTCGLRFGESFEKLTPASLSLRTSGGMCGRGSGKSSRISMSSGSTENLGCSQREMWDSTTTESGSSFWPTSTAGDSKSSGAAGYSTESGRHSGVTLTDAARLFALGRKGLGVESLRGCGLSLNPGFVEWLMDFPSGWISFERWGMESFPSRQRPR